MSATKATPSTYGIHFVKVIAIAHQVMVHAQAWLTQSYPNAIVMSPSALALKTMILTGAISMTVPMTATAILRLNFPQRSLQALPPFSWNSFVWLCVSLMFLESCKQVWLYGAIGFFEWDALHTIALTFLFVLLVGRYSILALWPIALAIISLGPLLDRWLAPFEKSVVQAHPFSENFDASIFGRAIAGCFMAVWMYAFFRLLASRLSDQKKFGFSFLFCIIGAAVVAYCLQIENSWGDEVVLRLLPLGALIGSYSGHHIWGFFPWAGVIILGFLVYDLLIRHPQTKTLLLFLFLSAVCFFIFYWQFADQTIDRCTPHGKLSGFNGVCFNRTHGQILLIVACFLLLVVAGRFVEVMGWEVKPLRAVSRSILWIYLFATVPMQFLSQWWVSHIAPYHLIWSFVVFCLFSAFLLAVIIDQFPREISITLRKVETA